MSGGPHGRGKAPERTCLSLEKWPAQDRALWQAALAPPDPFAEHGGERDQHRPRSNHKVEQNYGRWLTFLDFEGLLQPDEHPAERITPELIKAFIKRLQALENKKNTILGRLEDVGIMARLYAPERDWSFINRLASKVRAGPNERCDKRSRLKESNELFDLGLKLMAEAPQQSTQRLAAIRYRDGLIIALLALRPLRRGNFVSLTLGSDLRRTPEGWEIDLAGSVTKNHAPHICDWPSQLLAELEVYLAKHRPRLMACRNRWHSEVGDRLWVSSHGSPLTEMAFYDIVIKRTRGAFGKPLNPHLFRDAAATTTAIHDPDNVRMAAPLLGHRSFATTERYYNQANSLVAHRSYVKTIRLLRDKNPDSDETPE